MKRFFQVFSIVMIVFLVLAAGCLAAVQFGSIQTHRPDGVFLGGRGITRIPYQGNRLVYPEGDLFLVKKPSGQPVAVGNVVLATVRQSNGTVVLSALITGVEGDGFAAEGAGGAALRLAAGDVLAVYAQRIRGLAAILDSLSTPAAIVIYALVLAGSIALWRALPARPEYPGISSSDGEISSNLY